MNVFDSISGCHRLVLLSLLGGNDISALERLDVDDDGDDNITFSDTSSSSKSARSSGSSAGVTAAATASERRSPSHLGGLRGAIGRAAVDMWHTLAELVYRTPPPALGRAATIALPPLLRAHVDALTVQRCHATAAAEWCAALGDWVWATALHALTTPAQLALLLCALLRESRLIVLDLPASAAGLGGGGTGDAQLATACVLLALTLVVPLQWAGFVLPACAPSQSDLLSAPGSFIVALLHAQFAAATASPAVVHVDAGGSASVTVAPPTSSSMSAAALMISTLQRNLDMSPALADFLLAAAPPLPPQSDRQVANAQQSSSLLLGGGVHVRDDLPEDCVLWIPLQRRLVVSSELAKGDMLARQKLYVALRFRQCVSSC